MATGVVAPVALVTGVSREVGIGFAVAERLAADGFRVACAGWRAYDHRMTWGADAAPPTMPGQFFEIDFEDAAATASLLFDVGEQFGLISALVMCHAESVDSDIHTTTVESFDRHMAVNARATWQLIKGFSSQFVGASGSGPGSSSGRILSITSDHTAHNLPYGASKGAMDRIVLAAAVELAEQGITANVVNPGATDTGWMSPEIEAQVLAGNLQPRLGQPADVANLVSFLCSPEGQWVNAQLLYSNGGIR